MLGCHDFCGYYEWTFHYLRRRFGDAGVEKYWADAIASDAQQHYVAAAKSKGLQGLYESWLKTGADEECDWTVTLDQGKNLLRLDMKQCPSKGYLLDNRLNADEDYCDHCIGWVGPALAEAGVEVAAHEHNHCGQCWWEIRAEEEGQPPVDVAADIRHDSRWGVGYLHRFAHHEKLPILEDGNLNDSCDLLVDWFRATRDMAVLAPQSGKDADALANVRTIPMIVSGQQYAAGDCPMEYVRGVLLEHAPAHLAAIARRFKTSEYRPLLMHAYLPGEPTLNFVAHDLPRAIPILPLLIRSGVYTHVPNRLKPSTFAFAVLFSAALGKRTIVLGLESPVIVSDAAGRASRGQKFPGLQLAPSDLEHLSAAWQHLKGQMELPENLRELVDHSPVAGRRGRD